mmetsp:Transcript_35141/g.117425  ORF Transcript_35141/g.117425 Transcript_35141/m.117425 type:complete len:234 (+) Transcript_35141:304-1005(+)
MGGGRRCRCCSRRRVRTASSYARTESARRTGTSWTARGARSEAASAEAAAAACSSRWRREGSGSCLSPARRPTRRSAEHSPGGWRALCGGSRPSSGSAGARASARPRRATAPAATRAPSPARAETPARPSPRRSSACRRRSGADLASRGGPAPPRPRAAASGGCCRRRRRAPPPSRAPWGSPPRGASGGATRSRGRRRPSWGARGCASSSTVRCRGRCARSAGTAPAARSQSA